MLGKLRAVIHSASQMLPEIAVIVVGLGLGLGLVLLEVVVVVLGATIVVFLYIVGEEGMAVDNDRFGDPGVRE